jgi:hypothetical protein
VENNAQLVELRDVAPGLWIWRLAHPAWTPRRDWEPVVTSTYVESGGERFVLDPLAPPAEAKHVWARLDARPPRGVVVLKPDNVRDVDLFVERYGIRAFGPSVFFRDDIPKTELESIEPAASFQEELLPSTTGGIATRRRSGCLSSV